MKKINLKALYKSLLLLLIPVAAMGFMPKIVIPTNIIVGDTVHLPILMYHQLTKEPSRVCEYCVSVEQFGSDLDQLKKMGYNTVSLAQVIAFCETGEPLPPKPIVISFDDGFESFYVYAYPMLREREMRAVLAVIGEEAERFTRVEDHRLKYSCSPWKQLKEMADSGIVELASHSWDLHYKKKNGRFGADKKNDESVKSYREVLRRDVEQMRQAFAENSLPPFEVYVYPYGEYSTESAEILTALGIKAALICDGRLNALRPGDTSRLMHLRRFNRVPGEFSFDGRKLKSVDDPKKDQGECPCGGGLYSRLT